MTNPLQSVDPLAPLLLRPSGGLAVPLRYRSGRVVSWDQITGENVIMIDGEEFTNIPVSPGPYVGIVIEGDTVTLYSTTDDRGITTYAVAGLVLTPPNNRIARAGLRLGYAYERRDTGVFSSSDAAPTNFGDFPTFSRPARLIAASSESVLECHVEGTMYGAGGQSEWDMGVLIDGVSDYVIATQRASNANGNAHTFYTGTICVPTGAAGTKTVTPRWRYNTSFASARIDGGDWFVLTVRETFIR